MLLVVSVLLSVTPVPVGNLVQHPAHFFDLDRRSVVLRAGRPPRVRAAAKLLERGQPGAFGRAPLGFSFPFGGKRWTEVWVNLTGCLTFGAPDGEFRYLLTWPDGTMRARAAMADFAALRGESNMIAAMWGIHDQAGARVWVRRSASEFVVTWDVARYVAPLEGYDPLGRKVFQARLRPNGEIELRYGGVAEKDGLVGVFTGPAARQTELAAGVKDTGSMLRVEMEGARTLVRTGDVGTLLHDGQCTGLVIRGDSGTPTDCVLPVEARANGNYWISKLALTTPDRFIKDGHEIGVPRPHRYGVDLSATKERWDGSFYEVFHYPFVWKSRHATFHAIHRSAPADAELGIAFIDFRIDDLHNHGSSNHVEPGASSLERFGSPVLLSTAGPVSLGPRFAETIVTEERTYRHHAFGVGWMAHEMIHLWGIQLPYRHPIAGSDGHWVPLFETKPVVRVASIFADKPYHEGSIMGGMEIYSSGDGKYAGDNSRGAVSGLSVMDLWLMGLMEPSQIPAGHEEMRLVRSGNDFVVVRPAEVMATEKRYQQRTARDLRQAIYLLHENGRSPDANAMALAQSLEQWLLHYYKAASEGRMTVRRAHPE